MLKDALKTALDSRVDNRSFLVVVAFCYVYISVDVLNANVPN